MKRFFHHCRKVTLALPWSQILRISLGLGVLLLAFLLGHHLHQDVPKLEQWIRSQGAWAPLVFVGAFCILPLIMFPTDALCFAAGALFGLWAGLLLANAGILGSASLMFWLARTHLRYPLQKLFHRYPSFRGLEKAIERKGLKFMLLLRFTPLPFAPLSYYLGTTPISFKVYLIGTLGTFFTVALGVYFGFSAKKLTAVGHHHAGKLALLLTGLSLLVLLFFFLGKIASRRLKELSTNSENPPEAVS